MKRRIRFDNIITVKITDHASKEVDAYCKKHELTRSEFFRIAGYKLIHP